MVKFLSNSKNKRKISRNYDSLAFLVTAVFRFHSLYHSLPLVVPHVFTHCTTCCPGCIASCHSLSLVVPLVVTRLLLVCHFINDLVDVMKTKNEYKGKVYKHIISLQDIYKISLATPFGK